MPDQFQTYVRFAPSELPAPGDATRVAAVAPDEHIEISIYLRPRQPGGEPRTREAMRAEREAAYSGDIRLLNEFAAANGLAVSAIDPARRLVKLAGPAARMERAFRTTLHQYRRRDQHFRGRSGAIELPREIAEIVESVLGLDTRPAARPHFVLRPARADSGHLPNVFARLYDFPAAQDGTGQTIALIELGGGFDPADTQAAFAAMGVAPPQVVSVSVDGARNSPSGSGADGEVALDIQIAGGVAPGAGVAVYFAPNTDAGFADAISAATQDVTNKPSVISISWGAAEEQWSAQAVRTLNSLFQDAATLGISVFVAAGDSLATDGIEDGRAHVVFPASSPFVIGCGGTATMIVGDAIKAESVWNDGDSGTGGGISDLFDVPEFQAHAPLPPSVNGGRYGRGVPDVAGNAAPESGWTVTVGGTAQVIGGTSAVAPLWAGLIARINQRAGRAVGFFLDALYAKPDGLVEITKGSNRPAGSPIGYDAGPGWNACTGLGTPRGQALAAALAGPDPAAGGTRMATPIATAMRDPTKHPARTAEKDEPFFDPTPYGNGPQDNVPGATENAAITHHEIVIDGKRVRYTATAGHLVTVDPSSSKPNATIFYVAFTSEAAGDKARPVTFFYNGGPGSSSVYVLLGSFAPMRIRTSLPDFTPPAPYTIETNPDSLLDRSDLVFVNPVGTGYSTAIAPYVNKDFWGVDQDAGSLAQFIKRYLTKYDRWNSPKFLFGESYGTARTAVLSWRLHEDGVDLNGLTLQSSILDYSQAGNPVGLLPTWAADAWYHAKTTVQPPPNDLASFADTTMRFATGDYAAALAAFPKVQPSSVAELSAMIGIDETTLASWSLNVAETDERGTALFLLDLLKDKGLALGAYDGRATGIDTGIAAHIDPRSGGNDPTMTAVNGAYTAMWNSYLNDELRYTSTAAFTDLNDQAFQNWDFHHTDPTGAQKGIDAKGDVILYTAGDLAATMSLNVDLKVLSANGYYDSVTPFFQTTLDLRHMPLKDATIRKNLTVRYYPSGHMIYLDPASRTALKADLAQLYDSAAADRPATARVLALQRRAV